MDAAGDGRSRFRDLGLTLGSLPTGPLNAITDVPGVRVGHYSRRDGRRPGPHGEGPFNTGVTAIVPHGDDLYERRVPAAIEVLNGSGEIFGREFVDEMGVLDAPIMITGSFNVARVADAVIGETTRHHPRVGRGGGYVHPLVAECSDAQLSDLVGRPMGERETAEAWRSATGGPVAEGSVGAGTGFVCFQFKAGIGTASRRVQVDSAPYTVGALVAANTGVRELFRIDGVPVGRLLDAPKPSWVPQGSIIMVVATDAPLLSRQLARLARRAHLGLARTGATAHNGSGDFSIAFSTGNRYVMGQAVHDLRDVDNAATSGLFDGAVEATEEAIVNALCAATEIVGRDGNVAPVLPLRPVADLIRRYRALEHPP